MNSSATKASLLFLLLLAPLALRAQVGEYRNNLAVGASWGYALNTVGLNPKVPQVNHVGTTGGLAVRYTSEKYFSSICAVVGEINYAQIGWKEDIRTVDGDPVVNPVTGSAEHYRRDMTYVQVPVMARLGWGRETRGLQFFFQAGPQAGILLKEKSVANFAFDQRNATDRTSQVIAQDTLSVEHRFDYGITAGAGIELSLPRIGHFLVEGRYYYGLGDFFGNTKRDYFARSNHNTIVVKLTYLFDLTK